MEEDQIKGIFQLSKGSFNTPAKTIDLVEHIQREIIAA